MDHTTDPINSVCSTSIFRIFFSRETGKSSLCDSRVQKRVCFRLPPPTSSTNPKTYNEQRPFKAASGKSTSNSPINTPTNRRVLASSTAFSTQISMSCTTPKTNRHRPLTFYRSGSVCLDVINQTWSPMFDMINIFEVFLPQLLRYPNPTDPLNGEAAALLMREPKNYDAKVKGNSPLTDTHFTVYEHLQKIDMHNRNRKYNIC